MAQLVSDNFTRADAANLGANWSRDVFTSSQDFSIVSNRASTQTSSNTHADYWSAAYSGGNDQYAEVTIQTNPAQNDGGPVVRLQTGAQSYYTFDINNNDAVALGSSQHAEVFSVSATVFTLVGSTATLVINAGDVLRVEAQGTTIRGLVNGVQKASGTDSAWASGKVGMAWWEGAAASTSTISLWAAGDFSSGAVSAVQLISAHRPAPFKPGGPRH